MLKLNRRNFLIALVAPLATKFRPAQTSVTDFNTLDQFRRALTKTQNAWLDAEPKIPTNHRVRK